MAPAILFSLPARSSNPAVPERRAGPPASVVLALVSALSTAGAVIALDATPANAGLNAGVVEILVGLLLLAAAAACRRLRGSAGDLLRRMLASVATEPVSGSGRGAAVRGALVSGALLGAANIFLIFALQGGSLAVVAALLALYPLATVVLARIVLGEILALRQILGAVSALSAAVLLAL